ncbi:hypothetical protein LG311_19005 [Sutcliffiella horikoshii]|uniref:hypothetical protein n=1 Tax=Sutcliffiella horikoshii TaxID=79883 RepID=UPI00384EFA64
MKKLAILMFSLLMILSACGSSTDNNSSQNESNEEAVDSNASQGESNEEQDDDANVQQSVGVFKGWADNHTIEVETDNGYVTYYVSPENQEAVNAVEEGSEVTISFIENEGRMELQSVQAN